MDTDLLKLQQQQQQPPSRPLSQHSHDGAKSALDASLPPQSSSAKAAVMQFCKPAL